MLTLYTFLYSIIACSLTSAIVIEIDQSNGTPTIIAATTTTEAAPSSTTTAAAAAASSSTTTTAQLIANSTTNAAILDDSSEIENVVKILNKMVENSTTLPNITTAVSVEETPKCKANIEVYSKCANSCPASCEDPNRKACRNFCWSGCECANGYVRNHRWKCIPVEECPKCSDNEHFRNCGSNCEPTCETYQNMPVECNSRARCKRGCFCNYGFVRDMAKNGTCVEITECPQKCSENEYWDPKGEPCIRTVENPRPSCLFESKQASCVCNTGFERDLSSGKCRPISTLARSKCSVNETFLYCGSECALNCFDESRRQACPTVCNRGCFCKDGYRRESSGRCVLPNDCQVWNSAFETEVFRSF